VYDHDNRIIYPLHGMIGKKAFYSIQIPVMSTTGATLHVCVSMYTYKYLNSRDYSCCGICITSSRSMGLVGWLCVAVVSQTPCVSPRPLLPPAPAPAPAPAASLAFVSADLIRSSAPSFIPSSHHPIIPSSYSHILIWAHGTARYYIDASPSPHPQFLNQPCQYKLNTQ
jgi:hypothetical protein